MIDLGGRLLSEVSMICIISLFFFFSIRPTSLCRWHLRAARDDGAYPTLNVKPNDAYIHATTLKIELPGAGTNLGLKRLYSYMQHDGMVAISAEGNNPSGF